MAGRTLTYGQRSESRFIGVHPELVAVFRDALVLSSQDPDPIDWTILEGVRTMARQRQLVAEGASQTMKSRHLSGHAIDAVAIVNGEIVWDIHLQRRINLFVQRAARKRGVIVEWGGNWKTLVDGPHWQLPWREYPR